MTKNVSLVKSRDRKRSDKTVLLFVLPAVILLGLFLFLPIVLTFGFSFMDFNLLSPATAKFSGLTNYASILKDPSFYKALGNSFYFTAIVVPYQVTLAFLLALLVKKSIKGIGIFRAAYFAPLVTSITVVAILWTFIYNPNPTQGLLNALLSKLGLPTSDFLRSADSSMNSIIFMSGWQGAGYQMMILLAGLQVIPRNLYEAAEIDVAGKFRQFIHVTLPGIKNVLIFVLLITTINAMKLFTQPYVMTQGGPKESTKTLIYFVYQQGFQFRDIGYASAGSILFFLIVVGLSFIIKKVTKAQ